MTSARPIGTALHVCNTESIGCVARRTLDESPTTSVIGTTSRGVFLSTSTKKILFLSYEPQRGPLTINIPYKITYRDQPVQMSNSHLFIGDAAIRLDTASLWQPLPVPTNIAPLPTRIAVLNHFLNRATSQKNVSEHVIPSDTSTLLSAGARNLCDSPRDSSSPLRLRSEHGYALLGMTEVTESLILNLGLGPGLTPSDDDVVMGFLLTLNRYVNVVETLHATSLQTINSQITTEARTRTTTLSANLIECAAQGLADERLIRVVDCIFTGDKNDRALDEMLGWGETSGLNVLVGATLAVAQLAVAQMGEGKPRPYERTKL